MSGNQGKNLITHGLSHLPEYRIWKGIRRRCNNKNEQWYHRYGGRGIKVCKQWNNFENFYQDMGSRPNSDFWIERINNNGNYEPTNCRWATKKEQQRNRSSNRKYIINNEEKTLVEWCEIYKKSYHLVKLRIRRGWNPKEALETKIINRGHTRESAKNAR